MVVVHLAVCELIVECSKNVVLAIMLNTGLFLSAFGAATLEGFTFPDYNLVHYVETEWVK